MPFSRDRAWEKRAGLEGESQVGEGPGRGSVHAIEGTLGGQQEAKFSLGFAVCPLSGFSSQIKKLSPAPSNTMCGI